ncbi:ubiquitin carboxyl-terminal hydrolase 16-like [Liolophura sinensis]|uniref:ubiquitin carboxyl-terminal hydrolase 16-like n=1 Tax=Liolophura sinensis TaxID=3198878 RepID=UPI00315942B7
MKVLETTPSPAFTMGKKKHKLRNNKQNAAADIDQSESSDEAAGIAGATGQTCQHIGKAVNFSAMRKSIQKQVFGECTSCTREALSGKKSEKQSTSPFLAEGDPIPTSSSTDDLFTDESEPITWVCLQCGHQGCDRNSQDKHSLRHHETPHSSSHAIVINTTSWAAWCYDCDDEVCIDGSKRLRECVEFLRKTAGVPPSEASVHPGRKGQVAGPSVPEQQHQQQHHQQGVIGRSRSGSGKAGTGQSIALCQKVKGLSNLGNTCFFNAVMQVVCQTPSFEQLIGDRGKKGRMLTLPGHQVDAEMEQWSSSSSSSSEDEFKDADIDKNLSPIDVVLPDVGSLTQAVLSFLHEMNNTSGKSGTVTPSALFGQVCKKAPRFRGYQQQDSHELLRYLLDSMKTEEIKRGRTGILKFFKLSENSNPKKIDSCTRMKVKEYGRQAKVTFVDQVFGGQLISTVVCGECNYVSQIFEPFLDLSLSITEEKPHRPNLGILGKKQSIPDLPSSAPKPNKYQEKKLKKQARRDAKRKQKTSKNKVVPLGEFQSTTEGEVALENSVAGEEHKDGVSGKDVENGDGSLDSDLEDTSDADVEDNVDTDNIKTVGEMVSSGVDCTGAGEGVNHRAENGQGEGSGATGTLTDVTQQLSTLSLQEIGETTAKREVNGESVPQINGVDSSVSEDTGVCLAGVENGCLPISTSCQDNHVEVTNGDCQPAPQTRPSKDEVKKEARQRSMATLGLRYQPLPRECSVMSSLHHFTSAELLTGNNKFGCEKCTKKQKAAKGKSEMVYRNASKHYLIFSPPAVLTLHFKRFEQIGYNSRKVNSHVDFTFLLDLSPFCSSLCQGRRKDQKKILYSLYGVVEHSGRLNGGHYTAYVKVRPNIGLITDFLQTYASHPRELIQRYSEHYLNGISESSEDSGDGSEGLVPPGRWYHISDNRVSEVPETSVQTAQAYLLFYERVC